MLVLHILRKCQIFNKALTLKRLCLMFLEIVLVFLLQEITFATTYYASTPNEIQSYTNILQAGDTLIVQAGTYNMNWNISDRYGTSDNWIVIRAINNDAIINGIAYNNVINIYNCHYVELNGFEITNSYAASGIDGIKVKTTSDHILMENLKIHDITGIGIGANSPGQSYTYFTVRHCHIYSTSGNGTTAMYFGAHSGQVPVHHCLIELNWIHNFQRKGIQFKRGTYQNIIRDNVIYNCGEAGIVLYKTDQTSSTDNNIIRGNAIWNTPEGIFAIGQTNIDNNVIFNCDYGIQVRNYGNWGMNDLYIRNNTIYRCNVTCLCLSNWNIATGTMVAINNACYQNLLTESAIQAPNGIGPGIVSHNYHYGQSQVNGSTLGNPPPQEFINPSISPGVVNLYLKNNATLRDAGTSAHGVPTDDFNGVTRPVGASYDVGAYEWIGDNNPGWQIDEEFKQIDYGIEEKNPTRVVQNQSICFSLCKNLIRWKNLPPSISITVYDVCGRLIHSSGTISTNDYLWYTYCIPIGVYYFIIRNSENISTGKVILLK